MYVSHRIKINPNLWLIPADDALDKAQEFLSGSGMSAVLLGKRIKTVDELFQYCIIDAPPQRSQLSLTTIGAADYVIVPAEASPKGVNSLLQTLELTRNRCLYRLSIGNSSFSRSVDGSYPS